MDAVLWLKKRTTALVGLRGISEVMSDESGKTVRDLVKFLYRSDQLKKTYNFLSSNCKHFARDVYNYLIQEGSEECVVGIQGVGLPIVHLP